MSTKFFCEKIIFIYFLQPKLFNLKKKYSLPLKVATFRDSYIIFLTLNNLTIKKNKKLCGAVVLVFVILRFYKKSVAIKSCDTFFLGGKGGNGFPP